MIPTSIRRISAFTLLELLVAMAVLALIGVVLSQIIGATGKTTRISNRAIDAASQARVAFDRLGRDFTNLVKRTDSVFVSSSTSPDLMLFLSLVNAASLPGSNASDNRGISVVAYRIASDIANADRLCLLRGARAINWNDTGIFGLGSDGLPTGIPAAQQPAATDFDVLAPGIIRLVVGYQLYPDNQPATLVDNTTVPRAVGQVVYSPPLRADTGTGKFVDLSRISAIVIGMVAIDLESLKLLSGADVTKFAGIFPAPVTDELPCQKWSPLAESSASNPALSSIPLPARQGVRVFQRFFPITPFASKGSP